MDYKPNCKRILNKDLNNIVVDNQELRITASIGIAIYPEDGEDVETLVKNADAAMYKAKEKGRNQYKFFKPRMNADVIERVSNENNLFILKNDTDNIIEYVEYKNKNTKKYSFWELLYND